MSDTTRHSRNWWAPSSKHAKRTAAGTAAIVVALALITWTVWASPSGQVSTAVHHALGVKTSADKSAQASKLQDKLDAAQTKIWKLEGQLQAAAASGDSRAAKIADLQNQLQSAQSALGAAQAQVAASANTAAAAKAQAASSAAKAQAAVKNAATQTTTKSVTPTAAVITAPTKAQVLAQSSRWYGLYTTQSPFNWSEFDDISSQKNVGIAPNMAGYFQGFDKPFSAAAVKNSWANGRLPMMTWETAPSQTPNNVKGIAGYTNADIVNGNFDAYLKTYADAIVANGMPLVIRLDHEMNGNWYNWSENNTGLDDPSTVNATGSYVAMWQHIWTIFQNEGANAHVIWDWSPTRIDALSTNDAQGVNDQAIAHTAEYYPGDQYVDWVGMSGYYRNSTKAPTFAGTFAATLAQLRTIPTVKKPIILSEIGATETGGTGQKAAWYTDLFNSLASPDNADIIGFNYFDEVATTYSDGVLSTNDWRINSRDDSLAAFKAGLSRTDINFALKETTQ